VRVWHSRDGTCVSTLQVRLSTVPYAAAADRAPGAAPKTPAASAAAASALPWHAATSAADEQDLEI
jgi:hypothetical protein